jgi:hypothetical protein
MFFRLWWVGPCCLCVYTPQTKLLRQPKYFKLKKDDELSLFGLDVTIDDVLMNNVHKHNQFFWSDGVPWHGAKEKDFVLIHVFIWVCCVSGNIVVDLTMSTCMLPCLIEIILLIIACNFFNHYLHSFPLLIRTSIWACCQGHEYL